MVYRAYISRIIVCEYQQKNGERFGESINNKIENDNDNNKSINKLLISMFDGSIGGQDKRYYIYKVSLNHKK